MVEEVEERVDGAETEMGEQVDELHDRNEHRQQVEIEALHTVEMVEARHNDENDDVLHITP